MLLHMFLYPLQAVLTTIFLCVSVVIVCDGAAYENSFCSDMRCPTPGHFRCKETRKCITQSSMCNRNDNCGDGSDEENCGPVYLDCIDGHGFHCDGGSRCIPYSSVCSGGNNCNDGSDEQNCLTRRCPYDDDFKCNDTGICIRGSDRCDGYSECQNYYGSASDYDEQNCDIIPCPYDGDHRCGDGRCVRSRYICDGTSHCVDGSDETNCYGMQFCPYDGDFQCPTGACIRSYEVCDGDCTCRDCSDEDNCTSLSCQFSSYRPRYYYWCPRYNTCYRYYFFFSCYDYTDCGYNNNSYSRCYDCGNATMISSRHVLECDGVEDCSDGNDELNCFERPCFVVDDFRCTTTGACIRNFQVCDGTVHCSDGSDEENCLYWNCTISGDVKCKDNGTCIHSDMVCNGVKDCMDGSDETNCEDIPCPYDDDFRCAINGACIRADVVCNTHEDCLDGSDEGLNYCPEDVTMGVVWGRSLTSTTHKHQCSSIHPSFKLADMVSRECMKNRIWAPVDVSQCVMDVDSPVVMILVVTLNTENTTKVQDEMDQIVQEINEAVIDTTSVQFVLLDTFENVSLKITYEFSTFTTEQLVELINYEERLTTLGSFSVSAGPQLTVFESTSACKCPNSVESSSINLINVNNTEELKIFSVCTGKPCQCSTSTTCQCVAPFAGNGVVCGRDSDGDGYADMKLDCDDPQCEQDICSTIYNPEQTNTSCGISTVECGSSSSDDSSGIGAAIGSTFVVTLLLSVAFTLLVVYIVYKIRTRKEQTASEEEVPTSAKPIVTAKDSDVYEFPENVQSPRYQGDPLATIQPNPSYDMHYFDTKKDKPVYANIK